MSVPIVSVVIPCFNDGQFLQEAVDSVVASSYPAIEVIIVNDGSTDSKTLLELNKLASAGHTVVHQTNAGQSSARNHGILKAAGSYIVTLDADNKIRSRYIELAVSVMELNSTVGVVYGKFDQFGSGDARGIGHPFDPKLLLFRNYIDTLAVFRKSVWLSVGGYDSKLKGNEDWDFWLRISQLGVQFHFIDEVMFDYRVKDVSMTTAINQKDNYEQFLEYFSQKHGVAFRHAYCEVYSELAFAKSSPVKFLLKHLMPNIYSRMKK